jgi:hypothetical protein
VKRNKEELTHLLLDLLSSEKTEYKSAFTSWWYNTRENGGMRLTSTGFHIMKQLEFEYWDFKLPEGWNRLNKRVILGLDRKLDWPYYYGKHCISFFNSQDAMMVNLTGDVEKWLTNNFRP